MSKLPALILSFLICFSVAVTSNAQGPATLQLGIPIERTLGPGQIHEFTVSLEENTLIQLVVDQRGIDVIVKVISPANKSLGEFDSPNGKEGPEHISFVGVAAGSYRITVGPLDPSDSTEGRYQIKIIELRQATEQELKTSKNQEVVKAKGLALLNEVEGIIPQIKSPQTRIRAQVLAAQLLWESNEKRASKYLGDAITGLKELLTTLDASDQQYVQQHSTISELRYQIVQFLATRDPDAALNFLHSTVPPSDPSNSRRGELTQESAFEIEIANRIMRNDPNRALRIARQTLKTRYSSNLISTVSQLRRQNPELAVELANEIVSKLLTEKLLKNNEAASLAMNLLRFSRGPERKLQAVNPNVTVSRPALLPDDKYRELFQKVVTEALSYSQPGPSSGLERDAAWNMLSGLQALGADLEPIVIDGMATVEKKLAELNGNATQQSPVSQYQTAIANSPVDAALEKIEKAPPELKEQFYIQLAGREANNGDTARARQIINDYVTNAYQRRQALINIEQQEIYRAINKGKVDEALRSIAALRTPRERALQLGQIANQIGPGQKRATAINLLEQARSMLGPSIQAQDEDQIRALFEIARAFGRYDSKRAFEIVDPLIDQVNELCAAARTLDGFGPEYYQDEELNLQNGNSLGNVAGQMSAVLGSLAFTNFERAKLDADRIQLLEVRLLAYLEIAQQTIQGAAK